MTIDEYWRALYRLNDDEFRKFNDNFGGGQVSRQDRLEEFVQDPKQERLICQLLHLVPQEERLARAAVSSARATWVSAGAALLAIGLAIWATWMSNSASERQMALSSSPRILVEPSELVKGEIGEFQLSLMNPGPSDLEDVRVYEDYFVSVAPEGAPIMFYRFGVFLIVPNSVIDHIGKGEKKSIGISFKAIHEDMKKFYLGDAKGQHTMLARLTIKFRRGVDGAEFRQSKAYIIAGHGDTLADHDERGIAFPGGPTFTQIKEALGVSGD